MARYVLQWKIHQNRIKETFCRPIYLNTAVNYLVLYQFVSLRALCEDCLIYRDRIISLIHKSYRYEFNGS